MKNKENKTARLLITRLAVQVRLGEPKESKPLREIAKAFFVFFQQIDPLKRSSGTRQTLIGIFTPAPHQSLCISPRHNPCGIHTQKSRPRSSAKNIRGGYLPFRLRQKSFYLECQRQPHNRAMLNSVDLEVIPAAAGFIVQPNSAIAQDGGGVFPKIITHYAHGVPRVG